MSSRVMSVAVRARALVVVVLAVLGTASIAFAQIGNNGLFARGVGGIAIDANGALRNAELDVMRRLREIRVQAMQPVDQDLNQPSELRKISLRGLEAAISESIETGKELPDEILFLAGLQQIRYVLVYPEQNDIVLAGYGEGWKVDDNGSIVGVNTGRPVLLLDDLLVALRSAQEASQGGISCSIDPTEEGLKRLHSLGNAKAGDDPRVIASSYEQALGPQNITVTGVPATSHFATVLVAADYRMKRLGMDFEESPVPNMPSYLDLLAKSGRGVQNLMPRWWLATDYLPLLADPEGLAWELRGPGVKCMTEDEFVDADGKRKRSGKASSAAQKWADTMTSKYADLSIKDPIFGELRNCMDLAVVGALIQKENLLGKTDYSMPLLLNAQELPTAVLDAPQQVDTKASLVERRKDYIVSASGGVMIHSWAVADKHESNADLAETKTTAKKPEGSRWWWN